MYELMNNPQIIMAMLQQEYSDLCAQVDKIAEPGLFRDVTPAW